MLLRKIKKVCISLFALLLCVTPALANGTENLPNYKTLGDDLEEGDVVMIYDEELGIDNLGVYYGISPYLRGSLAGEEWDRYVTYFKSVSWIKRDGVVSLSVYPHNDYLIKEDSWNLLYRVHKDDSYWVNAKKTNSTVDNSLYHQYTCHADWAVTLKVPWNLEPSKADKGYWGFVVSACN